MVAEDVPSYKIVNGQPAEPLLTRIVNRETGEQRWRLVKAAPLRGSDGELMAVSVIEDVTEAKEAELRQRFLAAGRPDARLLAGLRGDAAARRRSWRCPAWPTGARSTSPTRNRRLDQVAVAHVDPDKVALRARAAQPLPARPDDDAGIYGVLRSGRPSSIPRSPTSCSSRASTTPSSSRRSARSGMRSVMLIPMGVARPHASA